jgi:glutamate-1-semialdehyde 2,1-aminomutase
MGVVPPADGFLDGLRALCDKYGALLIFDEVMTGFRLAYGGAQELYGVKPDITCLGKIIGGGLPVGAYGGITQIMGWVAPEGAVYQAGTLSGNPLAVAAGIATLKALKKPGTYARLEKVGAELEDGLSRAAAEAGVPVQVNRVGSMFTVFFSEAPVKDFKSAKACRAARYAKFFHTMLGNGVYFAPSQFEACFVSRAHSHKDVVATLRAARKAFEAALAA